MTSTTRWIGLGLVLALGGLAGSATAQDSGASDATDLTPPDLSAPRSERAYRTCPNREPRPEWLETIGMRDAVKGQLLMRIYEARTYERIVATGDCSCAVKAPPWDEAEAEYLEGYAALDLQGQDEAEADFRRLENEFHQEARRICREQGNW